MTGRDGSSAPSDRDSMCSKTWPALRLHRDFSSPGWTVEDLGLDYGEDLLVRIFDEGMATPWSFYVQSKATDCLDKLRMSDGLNLALRVSSAHLRHWSRFWEPVVLAFDDANCDVTYWEVIQSYLKSEGIAHSHPEPSKTTAVRVPADNPYRW